MPVGTIVWKGEELSFTYTYKKVKNINLRITSCGEIHVSLPRSVSRDRMEAFLLEKSGWILENRQKLLSRRAAMEQNAKEMTPLWEEDIFPQVLEEVYSRMAPYLGHKPKLVIREMKTRWGSCTPAKGKITLNRKLLYAPRICIEYVVAHELIHFLHPDHSKRFYQFFDSFMPCHREYKKLLESQNIL